MQLPIDPQTARMLLESYRAWFGTPRIEFGGLLIDGRIRFREYVGLHLRGTPPTIVVSTTGDAARMLCLAGHYDRARLLVPSELTNSSDIAAYCHCDRTVVAAMVRKCPSPNRRVQRALNGHRRRWAIERMARLLKLAEMGTGTVTSAEIREALGAWL